MAKSLRKLRTVQRIEEEGEPAKSDGTTLHKAKKKKKKQEAPLDRVSTSSDIDTCPKVEPTADEKRVRVGRHGKRKKLSSETHVSQPEDIPAVENAAAMESVLTPKRKKRKCVATKCAKAEDTVAIDTFEELESDFGKPLLKVLRQQGYMKPTPVQAQSMPLVLSGCDVIAVAATGSGKTCAYILPALVHVSKRLSRSPPRKPLNASSSKGSTPPAGSWTCPKCGNVNWPKRVTCNTRTCGASRPDGVGEAHATSEALTSRPAAPHVLILAPTRELAQQIHTEACKFTAVKEARALCIYGGVPKGEQAGSLTSQGADIIVGTPGRCLDFLEADQFLGQPLSVKNVTYLVLDEADRMLEAGFLPAMLKIAGMCPASGNQASAGQGSSSGNCKTDDLHRQTLFFTATWPAAVRDAARHFVVKSAAEVRIAQRNEGRLTANQAVAQNVEVMPAHGAKLERVNEVLKKDLDGGTTMIFCKTQKRCDWLVKKIQLAHPFAWIRAIHAGKDQQEREDTMALFRDVTAKGAKQKGILVATNVAARGIDVPGVRLVIVYDFFTVEDYVHQIGRTGRAGAKGEAVTFYVAGDGDAQEFVGILKQARQVVPPELEAIAESEAANTESATSHDRMRPGAVQQGWKDSKWKRQRAR